MEGCKTRKRHAPKGQKHIAQGSALGKRNPHAPTPCKGKSLIIKVLPFLLWQAAKPSAARIVYRQAL